MIDPRLLNSLVAAMGGGSYYPYDYSDLSPEEAAEMKFIDNCLFGCSERISDACSKIQLLILEYASRFNNDTMSDEEFFSKKYAITKDLSSEEKDIIDIFGRAVFDTYGIYSEERVAERQLKKKGNDNNVKSK
jgi:hypothetical protein